MSGPMNENSTKKTRMPKPITASRLLRNSRSASRHPLWTAPTSPPSGARCTSSGGRELELIATTASLPQPGRSCQPDTRVRHGKGDIRDQVADDDKNGARQGVGEHHRIVDLLQALEEEQAEAGIVKQRLRDQVPRQQ